MNEVIAFLFVWAFGVGLGAFFFAGLWWTIKKGIASNQPALWFSASLILRVSTVLLGFYCVSNQVEKLLFCLLGFVMAGLMSTWLTRNSAENQISPLQEITRAP